MTTHKGSCHCGKIAYEVDGDITKAMDCNCSICSRRGYLLAFLPRSALRLLTPETDMSSYTFNTHRIRHFFCPTCGCAPFGIGTDPKGNVMAAINVRCLEDVDVATLEVSHFDGRKL